MQTTTPIQRQDPLWMKRKDWARGRIKDQTPIVLVLSWIMAVGSNFIVWTIILLVPEIQSLMRSLARGEINYDIRLVFLIFPVAGMMLLLLAAWITSYYFKYGVSTLELTTIPGIIGGEIAGAVRTKRKIASQEGFRLTLSCSRELSTGSGRNRSVQRTAIWEVVQVVFSDMGVSETIIPFSISILEDLPETGRVDPQTRIRWDLAVRASVPGLDYRPEFEVPVFRARRDAA